jgi:hypothetical protein
VTTTNEIAIIDPLKDKKLTSFNAVRNVIIVIILG